MNALAAAGEGSSFTFMIEAVGKSDDSTGGIRPALLIIASFLECFGGDVF